jgi:hypothetical protein
MRIWMRLMKRWRSGGEPMAPGMPEEGCFT